VPRGNPGATGAVDRSRSGLRFWVMPLRVIALLFAIAAALAVMVSASPAVAASPDVAGLVDDGALDPEPAITAAPVGLPVPVRRELRPVAAPPAELHGRLHPASVFRPPRRFAPA
jgi:hypothetical protein